MPDDLRWSWRNSTRNKVHNKCNALESSPNHAHCPWSVGKLSSTKLVPSAKKVGDHWENRGWGGEPLNRGTQMWVKWAFHSCWFVLSSQQPCGWCSQLRCHRRRNSDPGGLGSRGRMASWASSVAQRVKNPPASAGDVGLVPGLRRSPGVGNGNHSSILGGKIP